MVGNERKKIYNLSVWKMLFFLQSRNVQQKYRLQYNFYSFYALTKCFRFLQVFFKFSFISTLCFLMHTEHTSAAKIILLHIRRACFFFFPRFLSLLRALPPRLRAILLHISCSRISSSHASLFARGCAEHRWFISANHTSQMRRRLIPRCVNNKCEPPPCSARRGRDLAKARKGVEDTNEKFLSRSPGNMLVYVPTDVISGTVGQTGSAPIFFATHTRTGSSAPYAPSSRRVIRATNFVIPRYPPRYPGKWRDSSELDGIPARSREPRVARRELSWPEESRA